MKKQYILFIYVFMSIPVLVYSQSPQRQWDPVAMADREKAVLYDSLSDLSDDQKAVIDEIYNQYGKDMATTRSNAGNDREKMRTAMGAVRDTKSALLKEILTGGQWEQYEAILAEAQKRRSTRTRQPQK